VNDLARGQGWRAAARHPATDDEWGSSATGRHAFNEDAVLTPIFHALQRGGWRRRQHEPAPAAQHPRSQFPDGQYPDTRYPAGQHPVDPVDQFRRDPLTAPIPVQALVPSPSLSREWQPRGAGAHAVNESRVDMTDRGRHHRRREPVGSYR
jgi:hypothetical protein